MSRRKISTTTVIDEAGDWTPEICDAVERELCGKSAAKPLSLMRRTRPRCYTVLEAHEERRAKRPAEPYIYGGEQ